MRTQFTVPESEEEQVKGLHRLLAHGSAELIGPSGEKVALPNTVYNVLKTAVSAMQSGRAVAVIPEKQDMTTQSAAAYLGVSRPHIVKLLESRQLPFHKVGSHRRIDLDDLREFVKRRDVERHRILDQLAKEAYESGNYEKGEIPEDGADE